MNPNFNYDGRESAVESSRVANNGNRTRARTPSRAQVVDELEKKISALPWMADSMGMAFSIQGLLQCLLTVNKLLSSVTLIVSKCDRNFTSFRMPGII